MTLRFGKYSGVDVEHVPDDYLLWCLANLTSLRGDVRDAMEDELRQRGGRAGRGEVAVLRVSDVGMARELVHAGRRACAARFHPDRPGGNLARMQKVNVVADELTAALGGQ